MKRNEANAAGLKTYIADKPCVMGHSPTIRYVSTGNCKDCLNHSTKKFRKVRFYLEVPADKQEVFKQMCNALGIHVSDEQLAALLPPPPAAPRPPVVSPFAAEIARVNALYPEPEPVHTYPPLPPGPPLASPSL